MISDDDLNMIFDQLNIAHPKYIKEAEFWEDNIVTADIAYPETGNIIGHMTFNKYLLQ